MVPRLSGRTRPRSPRGNPSPTARAARRASCEPLAGTRRDGNIPRTPLPSSPGWPRARIPKAQFGEGASSFLPSRPKPATHRIQKGRLGEATRNAGRPTLFPSRPFKGDGDAALPKLRNPRAGPEGGEEKALEPRFSGRDPRSTGSALQDKTGQGRAHQALGRRGNLSEVAGGNPPLPPPPPPRLQGGRLRRAAASSSPPGAAEPLAKRRHPTSRGRFSYRPFPGALNAAPPGALPGTRGLLSACRVRGRPDGALLQASAPGSYISPRTAWPKSTAFG